MNTIKFNVEDSKVSEVLKALLNSGVIVKDVEIINAQHSEITIVPELCSVEDLGSSFTLYRHRYSIGQNEGSSSTEIISDVKLVGGKIFYIDDTADGVYTFFDACGNRIESVQVGDRPYACRVMKKGSKDKYYVYHDELYNGLRWTYYNDNDEVYESLDTSTDLGSGKINTETVMTKDNGAYITSDAKGYPTIWYQLQQVRNARVGGCDDWFVPSVAEIDKLIQAIESGSITGGTIAGSSYSESIFISKWLWSSSEYNSQCTWYWSDYYQYWFGYDRSKFKSVFFIRAF